jgi:predicted short-subunit dehydrogenase-like oxidoreductase (DUF2520 family)
MSPLERVMIVGPGRMGLALGYALVQTDALQSLVVCGRRPEPPSHPLFVQGLAEYVFGLSVPAPGTAAVLIAVPDPVVSELAHALALQGPAPIGCAAYHVSGALSVEVLAPLHGAGYAIGGLHPLQAISNPLTGADRIPGSHLAVTGSPVAIATARVLASALGCPILEVPESRRPVFHAAVVMASNFLPPLLDASARLLERAGVPYDRALPALATLVRGTLANIEEVGVDLAVTGPIARGDLDTIDLHLRALDPVERRLYALLGMHLARLAPSGVSEESLAELLARYEGRVE